MGTCGFMCVIVISFTWERESEWEREQEREACWEEFLLFLVPWKRANILGRDERLCSCWSMQVSQCQSCWTVWDSYRALHSQSSQRATLKRCHVKSPGVDEFVIDVDGDVIVSHHVYGETCQYDGGALSPETHNSPIWDLISLTNLRTPSFPRNLETERAMASEPDEAIHPPNASEQHLFPLGEALLMSLPLFFFYATVSWNHTDKQHRSVCVSVCARVHDLLPQSYCK